MCAVMGLAVVGAASANINPAAPNTPASVTPIAGGFTFTYVISVDSQQTVQPGDFFTFYDIPGFLGTTSVNPNWTAITTLTGLTATGATGTAGPNDNATIPNLNFMYTGTTPLVGQQTLGSFSFNSSLGGVSTTPLAFVGRATISSSNLKNYNQTSYFGPAPAPSTPEPATVVPFALGGLGLLGLIARKTRRTSGAAA